MKIIECEQGTSEWHESRRAKLTGTSLDIVLFGTPEAKLKLACKLVAEEATEQVKITKSTPEMERGTAEEVFSRIEFERRTGKKVTQLGFCVSDEYEYLGCSGDGWVEVNGDYEEAFETKAPDSATLVFYRTLNELDLSILGVSVSRSKMPFELIPADYKGQVINYFLVNEKLKKLYFVVYDPRYINDKNKMYIVTIEHTNTELVRELEEAKLKLVEFRKLWLQIRELFIEDNF